MGCVASQWQCLQPLSQTPNLRLESIAVAQSVILGVQLLVLDPQLHALFLSALDIPTQCGDVFESLHPAASPGVGRSENVDFPVKGLDYFVGLTLDVCVCASVGSC